MIRKTPVILILCVFAFISTPSITALPRSTAAAPRIRSRKVITLERTICFGSCPIYKLTIFSDGRVLYEGERYVRKKGRAWGRISRKALNELIVGFTNIYYFNLDNEYVPGSRGCPQVATDLPSAITSLAYNDRTKTIRHYHGCGGPSALNLLSALERKIDETVNVGKWIK